LQIHWRRFFRATCEKRKIDLSTRFEKKIEKKKKINLEKEMSCFKTTIVLLVLVCLLVVSGSRGERELVTKSYDVPLLVWSGKTGEFPPPKNVQHLQSISLRSVADSLSNLATNKHSNEDFLHAFAKQPEALLVFLAPKMSTNDFMVSSGAHHHLASSSTASAKSNVFARVQRYVENEKCSLVAPFLSLGDDQSLLSACASVADQLEQQASVLIVAGDDALVAEHFKSASNVDVRRVASVDELAQRLADDADALLENGVTDLIVVAFDDAANEPLVDVDTGDDLARIEAYEAYDRAVGQVIGAVKKRTTSYVALLSSAHAFSSQFEYELPELDVHAAAERRRLRDMIAERDGEPEPTKPDMNTPQYTTRWPSFISEGIMIAILLLLVLLVGMCCTCYIQTPDRFPEAFQGDTHNNPHILYPSTR
jgi:V0 complex accessory subunit Ac45/VOA1 transmembrane domain